MKIALVAMSGVRVKSAELRALGVTLPGFVERGQVIASMPSLALLTLAAVTPPGHDVSYHEVRDLGDGVPSGYDLVAISTYTAQADEAYALADRLRAEGTRVVLGGLHVTQVPGEALAHADAVVIGEAERLWPRVVRDADRSRLERTYREGVPGLYDLRTAPVPRFDLLDPERYNRITVQTHRGCPHDCEFCGSSKLYARGFRQKRVEQVMREIDAIEAVAPRPFIELADDNTFADRAWSKEFLRRMADRGVRWFTESDVSIADDDELLDLLGRSSCRQVLIGLESPDAAGLDGIDARNWKWRRHDRAMAAVEAVQSRGVSVNGCFIVGLDAHGPEIFESVRDFVRASGLADVQVTVPTPLPGTRLHARLRAEGRLLKEADWASCTLFDVGFVPKRMSVAELEAGLRFLFRELYSPEAVAERRRAFLAQARRGLAGAAN